MTGKEPYTPEAILCLRAEMDPVVYCTFVKEIFPDQDQLLDFLNRNFWIKLQILNLILLGEIEVLDYSDEPAYIRKFEHETKPLKLSSLDITKESLKEFPLYFIDLSAINLGWVRL